MDESYDLKDVIAAYLDDGNVDYSLLINGEWGCGKTYYFKNGLVSKDGRVAGRLDCTVIMLSIGGLKSSDEVLSNITMELLYEVDGRKKRRNKIIEYIRKEDFSSFFPKKIKAIRDFITKAYNINKSIRVGNITQITKNRLLFVIDDIERYDGNISSLFAIIHSHYVENGIHVVYLSNEAEIKENKNSIIKYSTIKEKYIRRTILFKPDLKNTITEICNLGRNKASKFSILFDTQKETIVQFCDSYGIKNFRIIMMAIDCYDSFVTIGKVEDEENQLSLFFNILTHMDCFARTNIREGKEFIEYLKSKKIDIDFVGHGYSGFFNGFLSFQDAIASYIWNGYARNDDIKKMIEMEYPKTNLSLQSLNTLYKFECLEKEEILYNIRRVLKGIEEEELPYEKFESIFDLFDALETEIPEVKDTDYKQIIRGAITDPNYKSRNDYFKQHKARDLSVLRLRPGITDFTKEVYNLLEEEQRNYDFEIIKSKFIKSFAKINEKHFDLIFSDYENHVFELICKCGLIGRVKELNNRGICNLMHELKCLKTKEKVESQKEFIEEVSKVLEEQLKGENNLDDYACRKRLELIEYIKVVFTAFSKDNKNE